MPLAHMSVWQGKSILGLENKRIKPHIHHAAENSGCLAELHTLALLACNSLNPTDERKPRTHWALLALASMFSFRWCCAEIVVIQLRIQCPISRLFTENPLIISQSLKAFSVFGILETIIMLVTMVNGWSGFLMLMMFNVVPYFLVDGLMKKKKYSSGEKSSPEEFFRHIALS